METRTHSKKRGEIFLFTIKKMFKGHCFPKAIILQADEYQPTSLNRKWSKRIIGLLDPAI